MIISKGTELSLRIDGTTVVWKSEYSDCNLEDLFQAFEGLLVAHTYPPDSVRRYVTELGEEYQELYNLNEKSAENETEN